MVEHDPEHYHSVGFRFLFPFRLSSVFSVIQPGSGCRHRMSRKIMTYAWLLPNLGIEEQYSRVLGGKMSALSVYFLFTFISRIKTWRPQTCTGNARKRESSVPQNIWMPILIRWSCSAATIHEAPRFRMEYGYCERTSERSYTRVQRL